jgi:hypothetical protein
MSTDLTHRPSSPESSWRWPMSRRIRAVPGILLYTPAAASVAGGLAVKASSANERDPFAYSIPVTIVPVIGT